jgi:hypothetical protein
MFTSTVKTCSIMSRVRVREINGKTFEFIKMFLMWEESSTTITIVAKSENA